MGSVKFEKQLIKQMKRTGTLAMCRLDNNTVLEKGLYYYQGNDFASELVYSVGRLCEPCLEHIDNNFKPLDTIQKGEFADVTEDIVYLLQVCRHKLENNNYNNFEDTQSQRPERPARSPETRRVTAHSKPVRQH